MSCRDEIESGCKKTPARCIIYEGDHSKCSGLGECDSYTMHDTLEDIGKQLDNLCDLLDVEDINTECIDIPVNQKTTRGIIAKLVEVVCELKENLPQQGDCPIVFEQDISCLELDYKCLADPCGEKPTNLKDLLQIIINKNCEE